MKVFKKDDPVVLHGTVWQFSPDTETVIVKMDDSGGLVAAPAEDVWVDA